MYFVSLWKDKHNELLYLDHEEYLHSHDSAFQSVAQGLY